MPPAVSRFQGVSNPFSHLSNHPLHQQPHLQQHQQNLGHPGFGGAAGQAHNINLFGPSQSNFPGANPGLGGGLGAGGLGAAGGLAGGGTGLASHAAQMGFAHGAQLQQEAAMGRAQDGGKGINQRIREVWKGNLAQEMKILRALVDRYPYISMDTEFPGVVARPMGDFHTKASYHYQTVRCNVDLLKIIQLGVTLFDVNGGLPPNQLEASAIETPSHPQYKNNLIMCPCTWTFNFQFSIENDMYNEESIQILKKSGADFDKHAKDGIDPEEFGSLLLTSGLTLDTDVNWISFHSGYDFAYLVKMLWCQPLPADEDSYRRLVNLFFPNVLDVKFLWRHANKLAGRGIINTQAATILQNLGQKSGLQDLADELGCTRVGTQHSAGSDAWLTGAVFWELRRKIFDGVVPEDMNGQMWGLTGVAPPASAATQAAALAAGGAAYQQGMNGQGMMSFHTGGTPNTHRTDGPSTPTTNPAGLAGTPGPHGGLMTPGGAFGNFTYGGK